jgi:hypothetical protein
VFFVVRGKRFFVVIQSVDRLWVEYRIDRQFLSTSLASFLPYMGFWARCMDISNAYAKQARALSDMTCPDCDVDQL